MLAGHLTSPFPEKESPTYVDVNTYAGANTRNCWQIPIASTCRPRVAGMFAATTWFGARVSRKQPLVRLLALPLDVLIIVTVRASSGSRAA